MNGWDIFRIILFLGAVQGIVMGITLWRADAPRKLANRFLAAILVFFAYRLISEALRSVAIIGVHSWTYHVFLEYNWIYGALIFLYIKSYILPDFEFGRKDLIHFVPVLLEFVFSNFIKTQNFFWDGTRESLSWVGYYGYWLWMHTPFQLIVFASLILFYGYRSKQLLVQYTADNTKPVQVEDVKWVHLLLKLYQWFSVLVITASLVDYLFFNYAFAPLHTFPVYIGMAILTYWLGIRGFALRQTPFLQQKKTVKAYPTDKVDEIAAQLQAIMEREKLYTNPELNLSSLAAAIDLKPYQLTQVLNRALNKSFSEYVNSYRVQEAIRLINDEKYEQYTLLAIAFESGFNSKASFNRIVKKITGKSPKDLKEKSLN